ncbi:sacsin-like isoform X1 [Pomacea canaliculata]|uniref:sacsin-like isoform X1 n=2 Tax=Pomacea canaliculata TaxID=400727 RepID=UPI000D73CC6E|nr:sacsin-like isoform X1 [Pomacea canaliculata]XP_025093503.1 sacsin-like isoform X1 [Pomacea canaliculata]XP_025093504.1 sacsin-like isoform X1 [Pomacea canaliculata]XP_025093505.1 sacsin-like isoform X1 [Pomacea canaliculata]
MASGAESDGEEGEELGIIRATLIRELRNVLDEYPDDGQILKEMIQNAEDAGASMMKFVSDTREFNRNVSPVDIRKNPHLKFLKGPALYAFNNAKFSERDWQGIRMIHTSIKEADPLKVGRFGLGFKSVFHLTDRLTIVSGNFLLYMDPFKGEDRCCILKKLSRIKRSEKECLLQGLSGIFGVDEEMFQSGHYPGTMFWFPLRHEANDLSSTVYSVDKINDLWQAFKTEASGIPLFLKKIETVGLYTRRQDKQLSLDFQVGLATSCLDSVRRENITFIEAIIAAGGQMPETKVWNSLIKEVEMLDDHDGQSVVQSEKWLVVNYHPGGSDLSPELSELCNDPQLSYKPYVGVAAPLEGQTNFQSQIFCFLPLPLESRSPTGLPVHVNGFFALSQNRRHVKWPTADQMSHQVHVEPSLRWNRLLVEQLLPACYSMLLTRLRELHVTRPLHFYTMWPDMSSVTEKWQPLVEPLFVTMATKPVYCTEGGQWVELANALLSTITDDISTDIKRTVHKAYLVCQENLIVLPQNVLEGLSLSGGLSTVALATPQRLSRLLQSCLSQFESQERCHLLAYLCDQKDLSLLQGLQLLPLQDCSFRAFTRQSSTTFFCQEQDLRLFPGLETHFCSCKLPHDLRHHLHDIAVSGNYSLRLMAEKDVSHLLMKSIQCRFEQREPIVPLDDQWLQDVWNFLLKNFSDSLEDFSLMPLMPFLQGNSFVLKPLIGNYVCKEVSGMDPLSDNLITCLTKLGITVLSHLPDDVIRHPQVLGQLVQWPSPQNILTLLSHISEGESMQSSTVLSFNQASTDEDRACLIKLLDDCRDFVLNINLRKLLQQLNLFSCLPDRTITNVACVSAIAPDHLPPVPVPRQMLLCQESRDRRVALQLGGRVESLQDISREILLKMQPDREEYSLEQKQQFMIFFMDELVNDKLLCQLARRV